MPFKVNPAILRHLTTFKNILKCLFKFRVSISSTENDLVSPGLWQILASYQSVFQHMHPYGISVIARKIFVKKCSPLKLFLLKLSSLLLTSLTVTTSILLFNRVYFKQREVLSTYLELCRTFCMFYVTCIVPVLLPTNFTIAFGPGLICQIANPIVNFAPRIRGK